MMVHRDESFFRPSTISLLSWKKEKKFRSILKRINFVIEGLSTDWIHSMNEKEDIKKSFTST